jgi:hypothetical protein
MEQIAAYVSLFGVVLIARPVTLFAALSKSDPSVSPTIGEGDSVPLNTTTGSPDRLAADYDAVTPTQRATAVGIAMLGVFGAAGAYTTIRWIGKRAHPLISVNYFATWCTIVSIVAMLTMPGVGFLLPRYLKDWCYLIILGVCGFIMVSLRPRLSFCVTNTPSNSFSLQVSSTRSLHVQQTWCTCRCYSHLPLTSWCGAPHLVHCQSLVHL